MKKITMYSGDPCPYCGAAKALLKSKNIEIEEFDIWKDATKAKKCCKEQMVKEQYLRCLLATTTLVEMTIFKL